MKKGKLPEKEGIKKKTPSSTVSLTGGKEPHEEGIGGNVRPDSGEFDKKSWLAPS